MSPRTPLAALMACAYLAFAPASHALEALKLYDNFNGPELNTDKWPGYTERAREVMSGKLRLKARDLSSTDNDTDYTGTSYSQAFQTNAPVDAIRATITVRDVESEACASNSTVGNARARIFGQFFNAGTPTSGSSLNDVTAQLRVMRRSDSSDAPGVLRVDGVVLQCLDTTCFNSSTIGTVALGTATLNQAVVAELRWDRAGKRFLFARDGAAPLAVVYTQSDSAEPGVPNAFVGLRNHVPNCTDARRPSGMIDALFDNVYLNKSAVPF